MGGHGAKVRSAGNQPLVPRGPPCWQESCNLAGEPWGVRCSVRGRDGSENGGVAPPARTPVPVIILGSHIAALGVLRTLTRRGVACMVLDETSDIIVRSRWYRPAPRTLRETADPAILAAHLESLGIPRAVLIPCSDTWSLAVAGLPEMLRTRFRASVPSHAAVETFVDKSRFGRLIEDLRIPRPRTSTIRVAEDLAAVPDLDLEQGFLKPIDSQRYFRAYGTKGEFVASRANAEQVVREASGLGITFMVQEWISGPVSNTILLDGFIDRDGRMAALEARRRVRMDPPRIANTAVDVTIPLTEVEDAVAQARRVLAAVRYRGIFNIEFKRDDRDGVHKLIEVNARPFWLIAHVAAAGVDLPWLAYLDAQDLPVPAVESYETGRYGMYEVPEISALLRAWVRLRRPEGPVLAPWVHGDHTLLWRSDPMPGVYDLARAVRRRVGSWLRPPVRNRPQPIDAATLGPVRPG